MCETQTEKPESPQKLDKYLGKGENNEFLWLLFILLWIFLKFVMDMLKLMRFHQNTIVQFQKVVTHLTRNTRGCYQPFTESEIRPFEIVR